MIRYLFALLFVLGFAITSTAQTSPFICPYSAGPDIVLPCGQNCTPITATFQPSFATDSYTVSQITYNPPVAYNSGTATNVVQIDDQWSQPYNLPFTFCFFGQAYNQILIGSNGILTFNLTQAGTYCQWPLTSGGVPFPFPSIQVPTNSIMMPFQDLDGNPSSSGSGTLYVQTIGTAPCRAFVISQYQVSMYDCFNSGPFQTDMVVLYEGTNIIDICIQNQGVCSQWNSGDAIEGIQNSTGTLGYAVPGRANTSWTATNDAWRFSPSGAPTLTFAWLQNGNVIATTPTTSVCPPSNAATDYVMQVTYTNCDNSQIIVRDTMQVRVVQSAGTDQYVSCPTLIDSAVMNASGTGIWSALSTNPATSVIVSIDSPNTAIRGFTTLGTYNYVWTNGVCTDTAAVIVTSRPNAGPDVYTCVNGTATMAAIGTGTWAALPGNPVPTTITNPTANNTTITGFTVGGSYNYVWYVGNCYDTASVIIPNFVSSASAADTVSCKYQTTSLSATAGPALLGPFTYSWSPAAAVVSPTFAATATNPLLAPTTYILTVTSQTGCTLFDTVNIALRGAAPRVHITPSDNNVCPGATISLNSTVLVESIVQCGIVDTLFTHSTLSTGYVNNDTNSTTGPSGYTSVYGSPFMGSYNSYKAQYLITAAELNAAGLSSGTITDFAFFVKTFNSSTAYDTFAVSMGCTNVDSLTAFVNNLLVVVPGLTGAVPNQVTPTPGWTPINLTNYFNWDGVSNIVIQICYTINSNFGSFDDFVSYSTTSYNGSSIIAGAYTGDGCSLGFSAPLYLVNNTRPNLRFHNSVPNVLTYQWTPHTLLCDTCPNTQVVVSTDSTYTLTVNDNGCSNDTTVRVLINPYIGISAVPDTSLCSGNDTVQLNVSLSNPPVNQCVQGYSVTSIPYNTISGSITLVPPADYLDAFGFSYSTLDGTAGPYSIGFNFPFYCQAYSQFYVNSNGWITFVNPYPFTNPADEYTAQTLPTPVAEPQKTIELMMGQYWLADGFGNGGGAIGYFVSGTAPNRILVVQFLGMDDANLTSTTTGEMHLYEGSGVIDILLTSSTFSGTNHTTGIKDSSNLGIAAPGRNNQMYTISTPEAWRFTPQSGSSVAINGTLWSPNISLSNDTITNPIAYPTANQTYSVTTTLVLNQFTNPSTCVVRDSLTIRHGTFSDTVTASPGTICPGETSQLLLSSASTVTSYAWTPAQGLSDTTIANPLSSAIDTTTYYVTAVNNQGCVLTKNITVNVLPAPIVTLPGAYTICNCKPDTSVVPTVSGGTPGYTYIWSDGSTGPTTTDTTIHADQFTVTVTDANHCTAVSNAQVITMSCPRADITVTPGDTIFLLDTATLTATGSNYTYFWTSDSAFVIAPTSGSTGVIGMALGADTISLLITDTSSGCTYTAVKTIEVIEFGAFKMPTAFSPNGDNINDYFYPVVNGPNSPVKVISFRIYDRWGQLIYDTPFLPGWDGNFSGSPQPTGAYVYFVTAQYPDPNRPGTLFQKSLEGTFMLFR